MTILKLTYKNHIFADNEISFIKESNFIEKEYSPEAIKDALYAWSFARKIVIPINQNIIQKIHQRLMRRLNEKIAGKFRTREVIIGNNVGLPSKYIDTHLNRLCDFKPQTEKDITQWHIKFEHIHPFEDGNGRTGRIIMNLQRLQVGLPLLIIHEGFEQYEYYRWFK